jgi:hypothetical protein
MYQGPQNLISGFIRDVSSFLNKHPSGPHLFAEHTTIHMLSHYVMVAGKLGRCMRVRRDGEWIMGGASLRISSSVV